MALINQSRARAVCHDSAVDVLVGTSEAHIRYLADFDCPGQRLMPGVAVAALAFGGTEAITLIVPASELDAVAERGTSASRIVEYGEFYVERSAKSNGLTPSEQALLELRSGASYPSFVSAVCEEVRRGLGSRGVVALDSSGLLPDVSCSVREALGFAKVVEGYRLLQKIRQVKTSEEVARLKQAVEAAEAGLEACVAAFATGISEVELSTLYEAEVQRYGAEPTFAMIGIGAHGAFSNARASDVTLNKGDVVRFDIGCRYRGYHADIARCACFGDLKAEWADAYAALLDGELAAETLLRPDTSAGALFDAAVSAVRSHLPSYARHHVGHGIGAELYDPPIVIRGERAILEEGMVMNLETPYYRVGEVGLQVEDTYVITRDGSRRLTSVDRGLLVH